MNKTHYFPSKKTVSRVVLSICVAMSSAGLVSANPVAQAAPVVAGLPDFTDLVDKVGPAVVNIRTTEKVQQSQIDGSVEDQQMQEFFQRFFGMPMPRQAPAPKNRKSVPQDQR